MGRAVQFALLAALLGFMAGCSKGPASLDTIISARNALDYSVWEREHLPQLAPRWAAEFPKALFRLRVAEAYRTHTSKPEDVDQLMLKKLHGSTIREVLLESYRIKLYQLVSLQKLVEELRRKGHPISNEDPATSADIPPLVDQIKELDPQFDLTTFAASIHVDVPDRSKGEADETQTLSPGPR